MAEMKSKEAIAAGVREGGRQALRLWGLAGHWKDCGFHSEGKEEPAESFKRAGTGICPWLEQRLLG